MKNTYLILMFAAFSFWNESANAQAYACCNSDATQCVGPDGQLCCSYATGSIYNNLYCGTDAPGAGLKGDDVLKELPQTCTGVPDYKGLCQGDAPPKKLL